VLQDGDAKPDHRARDKAIGGGHAACACSKVIRAMTGAIGSSYHFLVNAMIKADR
jgi:hypothetical protein